MSQDLVEGTNVGIVGPHVFGILNTAGMQGKVVKVQDAGEYTHCVEVYLSRIYKPCFWYHHPHLLRRESEPVAPNHITLSDSIGGANGGRVNPLPCNTITIGCLRSWMHARIRPAEGHHLEELIVNMGFDELEHIYRNVGDVAYLKWVSDHDMRPKRAKINIESEVEQQTISIRRPRMGGSS